MHKSLLLTVPMLMLACGDDPVTPSDGGSSSTGGTTSDGSTAATPPSADETGTTGEDPSTDDSTGDEPDPKTVGCTFAGFEETAFSPEGTAFDWGEVTPDFTLETLRGPWTLSDQWGDCSVVTLLPFNAQFTVQDVADLVEGSAPNNTYLIYSRGLDPTNDVSQIGADIEAYLEAQGPEVYEEWTERFRYVTQTTAGVPLFDATDAVNTQYFVIDSRQRLRDAGSYNAFNGDFTPAIEMAKFGAHWFNYERRTEDKLEAEARDPDVLIVPWVTEGFDQTDEGRLAIELPSAEEMARYDRMEIVVKETCGEGARFPVHFGLCPAWDVGHKISLCEAEDECTSDEYNQLYRYITGYHSGVWLYEDVSHGLPWFKQGGTRWLRTNRGDFVGTVEFHFFDDGEPEPSEHIGAARHLTDLGVASFDATHNDSFPSYSFTPPPGTVRVMLDARVQGGGNQAGNGCAEFCSHEHDIAINGQSFQHTFVMNQSGYECAERTREGVTAGQFGTWFFDRGSWCPGGPVERWQVDITDAVDLEGPNDVVMTNGFAGNTWPPGGGLTATVWVVFYGADGEALIERQPPVQCANPPTVTVRDFSRTHPDFEPIQLAWTALADGDPVKEAARGALTGVVAPDLVLVDDEWKPQLIWPEDTLPYTTAASFDDWWRDSADSFTTVPSPDTFVRSRQGTAGFFRSSGGLYAAGPLIPGDFGYGNEELTFNLHGVATPVNTTYTAEIVGDFEYQPGQRLRFASKADLFVFIDHQLVHESGGFLNKNFGDSRTILELDDFAGPLGLVAGDSYDMHIFAAGTRGQYANPQLWIEHPACD
ncbi:MAG: peptide-N-glycosidase F-related protein [Myxococcota bacterium]